MNLRLPADGVGLDQRIVDIYLNAKVLVPQADGSVDLRVLREGEHYVKCRSCGAKQIQILPMHLRKCSGIDLKQYQERFPDAQIISAFGSSRRTKTEEQKLAQSEKLKARFRTPEGEETRKQISAASKTMQSGEYGQRAAAHLRKLGQDPEQRAARQLETKARWEKGSQRQAVEGWHKEHKEESKESIAHARSQITCWEDPAHREKMSELSKERWRDPEFREKRRKFREQQVLPVQDTKIEVRMQQILDGLGVAYEKHKPIPGLGGHQYDILIPALKAAVEVNGCFWHNCQVCKINPKGEQFTERDELIRKATQAAGWRLLEVWEHEFRDLGAVEQRVRTFLGRGD